MTLDNYQVFIDNVQKPLQEFTGEHTYRPLSECYKDGMKNIEFEVLQEGSWKLIKGTPRDYGYKFVMWEPFFIFKGLCGIKSEQKIRNVRWV